MLIGNCQTNQRSQEQLYEYIVKLKFGRSTCLLIRWRNPKEISEVNNRQRGKKSNEETDTK